MGWVGVAFSALGAIRQANQEKSSYERDARLLGYKKQYDEKIAEVEAANLRTSYKQVIGKGDVANAASGFDPSSKSSVRAIDDIIRQSELDAASINMQSELNSWRAGEEIKGYGEAARNAELAGYFNAASAVTNQVGRSYRTGF